jgi:ferredoxin-NADP reductase
MTDAPAGPEAGAHWQTAVVGEILGRTPRIKSFFVTPRTPFRFSAGQHVDLRLTAEDGYRAMRSYSIASAPEDRGPIELAIERLDDGEVSPFFHDVVAVGDEIELRGPLGGHFIWRHTDGGPLLLIGGGSGAVPLMAMIRHERAVRADVPTLLLLSARSWDDVLFRDELLALDRAHNAFTLVVALTRAPVRREGDYGRRIDAAMIAEVLRMLPAAPKFVFVCGSNPFVNAAADAAIASGVPAAAIRTERYGV